MFSSCRVGPARAACAGPPFHLDNHWWAGATRASLVPPYLKITATMAELFNECHTLFGFPVAERQGYFRAAIIAWNKPSHV